MPSPTLPGCVWLLGTWLCAGRGWLGHQCPLNFHSKPFSALKLCRHAKKAFFNFVFSQLPKQSLPFPARVPNWSVLCPLLLSSTKRFHLKSSALLSSFVSLSWKLPFETLISLLFFSSQQVN